MGKQQAQRPTEHDDIVRALSRELSKHKRVQVEHSGGEANDGREGPDVVLRDPRSRRLLRVCAIETRCSMTRPRSERWLLFASFAPLTLIVPKGAARDAERWLRDTDARIVEYKRADDGEIVFRPAL